MEMIGFLIGVVLSLIALVLGLFWLFLPVMLWNYLQKLDGKLAVLVELAKNNNK